MTANITKMLEQERVQAEKRGEARGAIKGKLEIAKKMIAKGMSMDEVIDMTDLTIDDIKGLE